MGSLSKANSLIQDGAPTQAGAVLIVSSRDFLKEKFLVIFIPHYVILTVSNLPLVVK